jgi:hypothetical protein
MSADQRTHEKISAHLCGRAVELGAGHAKVVLDARLEMTALAVVPDGHILDVARSRPRA